jgi:uncharacterized lipoprotein YajG
MKKIILILMAVVLMAGCQAQTERPAVNVVEETIKMNNTFVSELNDTIIPAISSNKGVKTKPQTIVVQTKEGQLKFVLTAKNGKYEIAEDINNDEIKDKLNYINTDIVKQLKAVF